MKRWSMLISTILLAGVGLEAGAESLEVGGAKIGISKDDFLKISEAECRRRGMTYKYLVCKEEMRLQTVPVTVSYYFGDVYLSMMNLEFDKEYYDQVLEILSKEYGPPTNQKVDKSLLLLEWDLPEEHVDLATKKSKRRALARIVSTFESRTFDLGNFQQ